MKPKFACVIICNLTVFSLYASDTTASWLSWTTYKTQKYLNTNVINPPNENNKIHSIEVLDMRSERSYLGLYGSSGKPVVINLQNSLGALFNSKLSNDSLGQDFLLVISDLWISGSGFFSESGELFTGAIETAESNKSYSNADDHRSRLKVLIDVFVLDQSKYFPLTRLDTTILSAKGIEVSGEELTSNMLFTLSRKLARNIDDRYLHKRSGTKLLIHENYNQRFMIPALTSRGMKKGVYESWEQFKNNQPLKLKFKIQNNNKEPRTLYVYDNSGREALTRDVFAVCDGSHIYKVDNGYVFDMFRNNTSIYWLGTSTSQRRISGAPTLPAFSSKPVLPVTFGSKGYTITTSIETPYILNIETGKAY